MSKTIVIVRKEWSELRKDVRVLLGALAPALVFALLPLLLVFIAAKAPLDQIDIEEFARLIAANSALTGLSAREIAQAVAGIQSATIFLLLPIITPSVIASYSIVGEKTNRTLEPLLATPVRTRELLLGKILASLLPAVAVTWLAAALFAAGVAVVAVSRRVFFAIVSPAWLLIILVITPLIALIVVAAMVAVSSRVNDPRTAQQVSSFLVVPFVLLFVGQIAGLVVLQPSLVLVAVLVLASIAALALWGVTRIFRREVILTRWR